MATLGGLDIWREIEDLREREKERERFYKSLCDLK